MPKYLIEALKEAGRVVLIAVVPILVDQLSTGEFNLRLIWVAGAIAGLRFLDKLLHEAGKEAGNDLVAKGLTRF